IAVGTGAIADNLSVDRRAALQGVLQLFQHQNPAATGDDEAVAGFVIGTGGLGGRIIVFGGQGAHGVEQHGQGPVLFFTAAGENDVLAAGANLLHGVANTVGAGGAGGGN